MKVIDAHCHIYPEAIAAKAVESVGKFYGIEMTGEGTVDRLIELLHDADISASIVHSVALRASNVQSINDFISDQAKLHPEFIGFATIHHDFEDMSAEIERCISLGLKGFKLHPDSQNVNADDPRLMKFYELIEGRLPLILHCGDYRYDNSHPKRIKNILQTFPKLVLNAAHFGGWSIYDIALDYLKDENCFMDISSSSMYLGPRRTTELINIYGAERIMFASDYPMWSPAIELKRFMQNDLSESQRELALWRNAERFIGAELG